MLLLPSPDPVTAGPKHVEPFIPCGLSGSPIKELDCPSLEKFSSDHFQPKVPVKIKGNTLESSRCC